MVDRTQEDINQDVRIGNAEQRIRELADKFAELSRRVDSHKAWAQAAVDHLGAVTGPVAHIEQRVLSLEEIVKGVIEWIDRVKHKIGL